MAVLGRFFEAPAGSFFLFGPRGTGKSTWLRQRQEEALWLDLLDPEAQRLYQARPERLRERIEAELGEAFDLWRTLLLDSPYATQFSIGSSG